MVVVGVPGVGGVVVVVGVSDCRDCTESKLEQRLYQARDSTQSFSRDSRALAETLLRGCAGVALPGQGEGGTLGYVRLPSGVLILVPFSSPLLRACFGHQGDPKGV